MAKQSDTQRYLVDHLGRKVVRARLEDELAAPTVTGVRSILSGHPAQNLTPERLARLLLEAEQGDMIRYLELAEEIEEKDAHYRSVLATRKLQVSGLDLVVEAASDEAGDIADADFVRDFLRANVLQQALFDILDAVGKGFSCCEILWECTEKTWLPSRILWRDPRWFAFDQIDGTTPLLIGEHGERLPLAPCKFIFHVHKSKSGLPCRGGIARAAAWNYLFKNFDLKAWMIFAEVYGHPLRLGKYDASATEEDKLTLLRAVRDMGMDHAAIIPQSMAVEFQEAKALGTVTLYEKLAEYLDRQISKVVLGQTGTTDTGTRVGTANAHERVRDDIERSDAAQLSATLNRDLIRPLVRFNRGERALPGAGRQTPEPGRRERPGQQRGHAAARRTHGGNLGYAGQAGASGTGGRGGSSQGQDAGSGIGPRRFGRKAGKEGRRGKGKGDARRRSGQGARPLGSRSRGRSRRGDRSI